MTIDSRSALNASTRAEHLASVREATKDHPLDLLIVGGGINGAGAAFDAATRGKRVAVVDKQDWAEGTSSRSSKLMHGGLRYLQMLDFKLVAEALRERDLLLTKTAPHLVKPISFVFPMKNHFERAYIGSGIALYDAMQVGHRAVPMHRHLLPKKLEEYFPGLDPAKNAGGIEYFDAQMDDARFVMMLIRSAVELGSYALNYTQVVEYLKEGPAVRGARLRDLLTGEEIDVYAKHVILAGGVWTGEQQEAAGAAEGLKVLASKGIHVTVPREAIEAEAHSGVITQTAKSVLFIIPWDEYWLIGTTDTAWTEDVGTPAATQVDIEYVLAEANKVLKNPLTRDDVIGAFAGLRPLLKPAKKDGSAPAKVSREHTVMEVAPGMSAIAGGKYTTYRVMAEDIVSFALERSGDSSASKTRDIPVIGAEGFEAMKVRAAAWAAEHGIEKVRLERLLFRYGSLLQDIIALTDEHPDLLTPLANAQRYLRAEIVYAAKAEGAVRLADILERRTRLFYEVKDRGVVAASEAASLLVEHCGWDADHAANEVEAYRTYVDAVLAGEASATDAEAAAHLARATGGPTREAVWGSQPSDPEGPAEPRTPAEQ